MHEASKTKMLWGELELSVLAGDGIDIGCGTDPVTPHVRRFDMADGDANEITRYVTKQFDFVFSSHCLEDMRNPAEAIEKWWDLVKPGGHLFLIVPDEDLYEQGVFPSRFNGAHRATFTISKAHSWSPVSYNVLDLALSLQHAELVSLVLQDQGYDRCRLRHGPLSQLGRSAHLLRRVYSAALRRLTLPEATIAALNPWYPVVDQTLKDDVFAQIQCIVRKKD
jgi:SAM-dependent methyltransferase